MHSHGTTKKRESDMLKVNDVLPPVGVKNQDGEQVNLHDFKGHKLVVYFYPKDNTPGCTLESCGFQQAIEDFKAAGVHVVGVSRDGVSQHKNFANRFGLTFPLLADTEGEICDAFGVMAEKSMFGKKYFGIQRSTFLVNEAGVIVHVWPNVSVGGHVAEVLQTAKSL